MISSKSQLSFSSLLFSKSTNGTSRDYITQVIKKNKSKSNITDKDKVSNDSTKKPLFLPSDVFKGPRPDYHFKKGSNGLGYYYYPTNDNIKQMTNDKVKKTMKANHVTKQLQVDQVYESIQSRYCSALYYTVTDDLLTLLSYCHVI